MKAPICNVCLNSDILCSACQHRLEAGEISRSDIEVSRKIYKLSEKIKVLRNAEIKKVIETENTVIIVSENGAAHNLVGKDGLAVKKISDMLGKNVRVIEDSKDIRDFIQKLLFPVAVLTMNVVYGENGEYLKVVVAKGKKLPLSSEDFGKVMEKVFGRKVKIAFE